MLVAEVIFKSILGVADCMFILSMRGLNLKARLTDSYTLAAGSIHNLLAVHVWQVHPCLQYRAWPAASWGLYHETQGVITTRRHNQHI